MFPDPIHHLSMGDLFRRGAATRRNLIWLPFRLISFPAHHQFPGPGTGVWHLENPSDYPLCWASTVHEDRVFSGSWQKFYPFWRLNSRVLPGCDTDAKTPEGMGKYRIGQDRNDGDFPECAPVL
jgi:hypothetical protein